MQHMFMGPINVSFPLSAEVMKTQNGYRELIFFTNLFCQCLPESHIFSEFPLFKFLVGTVWGENNFMVINTLQGNLILTKC